MGRRKLWLLGGLAAIGALVGFAVAADAAWDAGYPSIADLIGASKLAVCWLWLLPAWKSLPPGSHRLQDHLGRTLLAAILVVAVLT